MRVLCEIPFWVGFAGLVVGIMFLWFLWGLSGARASEVAQEADAIERTIGGTMGKRMALDRMMKEINAPPESSWLTVVSGIGIVLVLLSVIFLIVRFAAC